MNIYLAGAIRDGVDADVQWREQLIAKLMPWYSMGVRILNPLGDKTFNPETKEWLVGGIRTNAKGIVKQDLWSVRRSDIVIANVTSLAEGYPSIGTLMEMGAAAVNPNVLIYTIMEPTTASMVGNANPGVFRIHPFLDTVSTEIFPNMEKFWEFFEQHIGMLLGSDPHFGGLVR